MFADLATRDRRPEVMDDPGLAENDHRAALRGLGRLNRVSGIAGPVWRGLRDVAREAGGRIRVMDVACGGGDLLAAIGRRAAREGVPMELFGCDISATAVAAARACVAAAGVEAEFSRVDVLGDGIPGSFDVVMCHLFLHHLDDDDIERLLALMWASAGRLVLATDLVRDRRGYALAWAASRALTRSAVVHTDALLSVRAALRPGELRACGERAGLGRVGVRQFWPRRMMLTAAKGEACADRVG